MKFSGRTATAIITFPPDKILLIKRATVPFMGYWALPGGRVDTGETVEQTVVREVKTSFFRCDVFVLAVLFSHHSSEYVHALSSPATPTVQVSC